MSGRNPEKPQVQSRDNVITADFSADFLRLSNGLFVSKMNLLHPRLFRSSRVCPRWKDVAEKYHFEFKRVQTQWWVIEFAFSVLRAFLVFPSHSSLPFIILFFFCHRPYFIQWFILSSFSGPFTQAASFSVPLIISYVYDLFYISSSPRIHRYQTYFSYF